MVSRVYRTLLRNHRSWTANQTTHALILCAYRFFLPVTIFLNIVIIVMTPWTRINWPCNLEDPINQRQHGCTKSCYACTVKLFMIGACNKHKLQIAQYQKSISLHVLRACDDITHSNRSYCKPCAVHLRVLQYLQIWSRNQVLANFIRDIHESGSKDNVRFWAWLHSQELMDKQIVTSHSFFAKKNLFVAPFELRTWHRKCKTSILSHDAICSLRSDQSHDGTSRARDVASHEFI